MGDTLYTGGNIVTLDREGTVAEAVAVRNGRIVAVGSAADLELQFGQPNVRRVDLNGQTVIPGLIDSHAHLSGCGMAFMRLSLEGVKDRSALIHLLQQKAAETPSGEWIVGIGWDDNQLTGGPMLNRFDLDDISQVHPILLNRVCSHIAVANSLALRLSGIDERTGDPPGGEIRRLPDGQPDGFLLERAAELIKQRVPEMTKRQLQDGMRRTVKEAHRLGLTGIHTDDIRYAGGLEQTWQIFHNIVGADSHRLRCNLLIHHDGIDDLRERGWTTGYGDEWIRIGAMKLFTDGSMGGGSAWLSEPYADPPGVTGVRMHTDEELFQLVRSARELHMAVAVHAIGDAALDQTLTVLEQVEAVKFPDRLIHVQVLRPDLLARMQNLNIIADIQPRFVASDFPWVEQKLGRKRTEWAYAWKTLAEANVTLAGGSDAPVEPLNPLLGIHAAETRRKPGEQHDGYFPLQRLSRLQALHLFTTGAAVASGELHEKGTLEPGKLADFVAFSHDIVNEPDPDVLLEAKAEMTVVGGEIVYSS